jgi:dihydroorotate dehydrogenase
MTEIKTYLKHLFKHQTPQIKYFNIGCPHCQAPREFCTNRLINQTLYRVCNVCEKPYTVHIFPNEEKIKYEL